VLERQLQEWIALANSHLLAGDLTEARAACTEALRLLPDHADALQLSQRIEDAGAGHTMLAAPPADLATREAGAAQDKTRVFVRPPAGAALADALTGPIDFTEQSSAETHLGMPVPAAGVPELAPAPAEAPRPPRGVEPAVKRVTAPARRRTPWLIGGVVAAAVAFGAACMLTLAPAVIVRQPVVIDALPWGTVQALIAEDGRPQVLPADASTPLSLTLVPGRYRVTLVGPPPASVSREITLVVDGENAPAPIRAQFDRITPDQYFEQFVAPAAPAPPSTEIQEPQP
jgi:hypothetical protein